MAILTAGTHCLSVAGACANNTCFGTLNFVADASLSSGQAWLLKTFQSNWTSCLSNHGLFQFRAIDPQSNTTLMLLPELHDLFPSIIERVCNGLVDLRAKPVETLPWSSLHEYFPRFPAYPTASGSCALADQAPRCIR